MKTLITGGAGFIESVVVRYANNSCRISNELGWQPTINFEQKLEKSVKCYLDSQDWWQPLLNLASVGKKQDTTS